MESREKLRSQRHKRIKKKIRGSAQRPRMCIYRSHKNLYIQIVDDNSRRTLFSLSTLDKEIKQRVPYGGNIKAAQVLGEVLCKRAQEKNIKNVVFDRGGYVYHGRIKAFAEFARKGGLGF
jgi:large subunit ribosomal protein L18